MFRHTYVFCHVTVLLDIAGEDTVYIRHVEKCWPKDMASKLEFFS